MLSTHPCATFSTLSRMRGPFVVLDVHSYNHRRAGPDAPPAPAEHNPDVNVGTGTLDRTRFGATADRFIAKLREAQVAGRPLDVRENVRFRGGYFSRWVHEQYPGRGCALAIEFKKTFMDEWTGIVDDDHVAQLGSGAARHAADAGASLGGPFVTAATSTLSATDLAVDHELADIAMSFDFLLDVSPVNGVQGA